MHLLHCEVPEQGVLPPAPLLLRGKRNEFRSDEMRFSLPDNRTTAAYQNIVSSPEAFRGDLPTMDHRHSKIGWSPPENDR